MKAGMIAVTLVLCFAGAVVCLAQEWNMGTWKLNEDKSKFSAGAPKSTMVVYEAAGDSVKVTIDGTSGDGKPTHTEWTGKFDGKDYPVTGDPNSGTRSYTKVNAHTLKFKLKSAVKVTFERHHRHRGRREEPHRNRQRDQRRRQESQLHGNIRQAMALSQSEIATPFRLALRGRATSIIRVHE
jgi:hypothetical protein